MLGGAGLPDRGNGNSGTGGSISISSGTGVSSRAVTKSAAELGTSGASEAMTLTTGDVANSNSYSLTIETKNLHV